MYSRCKQHTRAFTHTHTHTHAHTNKICFRQLVLFSACANQQ